MLVSLTLDNALSYSVEQTLLTQESEVEEVFSAANENRLVFNCINPPAGFFSI